MSSNWIGSVEITKEYGLWRWTCPLFYAEGDACVDMATWTRVYEHNAWRVGWWDSICFFLYPDYLEE